MAPLPVRFLSTGTFNGHVCHVFLATDLAQVGTTADLLQSAGEGRGGLTDAAAARFQTSTRASKRMPPSGVLLLVRDGRPAEYEAAPLALVQRSVRCNGVRALQLAFGEEQRLAEVLAQFPIGDQRRAAMRTLLELRGGYPAGSGGDAAAGTATDDGRLEQVCVGALQSLHRLGLAFECCRLGSDAGAAGDEREGAPADLVWDVALENLPQMPTQELPPKSPPPAATERYGTPATKNGSIDSARAGLASTPPRPYGTPLPSSTRQALDLLTLTPGRAPNAIGVSFLQAAGM
jgi:hypothetical protein